MISQKDIIKQQQKKATRRQYKKTLPEDGEEIVIKVDIKIKTYRK